MLRPYRVSVLYATESIPDMVHDYYYLIKPSAAFRQRYTELGDSFPLLDDLLDDVLWRKDHPDRSSATDEDHLAMMKLLFIAHLIEDRDPMVSEFFGELFPSISIFDKWWTAEKFGVDVIFEDEERIISPETASTIEKTNIPLVDNWIDWLQARNR